MPNHLLIVRKSWILLSVGLITVHCWTIAPAKLFANFQSTDESQVNNAGSDWTFVEGRGESSAEAVRIRATKIGLSARPLSDVKISAMIDEESCRFGQWQYGNSASHNVAVVVQIRDGQWAELYVDLDRDRDIEDSEKAALSDGQAQTWVVRLDAEQQLRPTDPAKHLPRKVLLRRSRISSDLLISTWGEIRGEIEIDGRKIAVQRHDVNGNGIMSDSEDQLWLDIDEDAKFDPISERFSVRPQIVVSGRRYSVRSDVLGNRLELVPILGEGEVRFSVELTDPAAQIVSIAGTLSDESGSLVAIQLSSEPIKVPIGRYSVNELTLIVQSPDVPSPWYVALSRGRSPKDDDMASVLSNQLTEIKLLTDLKFTFEQVRMVDTDGSAEWQIRPYLFTPDGLYVTEMRQSLEKDYNFASVTAAFQLTDAESGESQHHSCGFG